MNSLFKGTALVALAGAAFQTTLQAAEILVTDDITTSTTWTADNTYNLQGQIFVRNGASLTIEAGTVVASTANLGGSLAVVRGSQIFINGTATAPVIMTSTNDTATWVNGDPKTGVWREAANEWGNLTIMGNGYISENEAPAGQTNTPVPSAANEAVMEGLTAPGGGVPTSILNYGGGDDGDDSGSISYLSMRYGGKAIGLNNELNGLSLGGIGEGTDLNFIEIMNNVDDGIEIWGGKCSIKNYAIWNVGDDSFDVDQGWRGKAQFGLIVQGYSLDANQGSGIGDNAYEIDGAEDSDWQPVSTAAIYNSTVVGQPEDGDGLTTWRDGARVQYGNCIFMDGGERVIKNDGDDGDGANGYGFNGTLTFTECWSTPYTQTSVVNAPANPAAMYTAQSSGNLSQITDTVFFRNQSVAAYTFRENSVTQDVSALGLFDSSNNNVNAGDDEANSPIQGLVRGELRTLGNNKDMLPVLYIDPRAANDAVTSVGTAPNDGFFTQAQYRGAFDSTTNWLEGWSAADAFNFFELPATVTVREDPMNIQSSLTTTGVPEIGNAGFEFVVDNPTGACGGNPGTVCFVFVSLRDAFPAPGGAAMLPGAGCGTAPGAVMVNVNLFQTFTDFYMGAPVSFSAPIPADSTLSGTDFTAQAAFFMPGGGIPGLAMGSAVDCVIGRGQ